MVSMQQMKFWAYYLLYLHVSSKQMTANITCHSIERSDDDGVLQDSSTVGAAR